MASSSIFVFVLLAGIVGCAYSVGLYEQCAGEGFGLFPCNAGLTCYRRNKLFSSCQFSCPRYQGWECEAYLPPLPVGTVSAGWDQCGGDTWVGPRGCAAGFACYARSVYYSQCRPIDDCPPGWTCIPVVATTLAPTGPIILNAYERCNGLTNVACIAGTSCYRFNDGYSECRAGCPATWACETEYVGALEQCGGEGYMGVTRCASGLQCYVRNQWYAHCAASCPGAGWVC